MFLGNVRERMKNTSSGSNVPMVNYDRQASVRRAVSDGFAGMEVGLTAADGKGRCGGRTNHGKIGRYPDNMMLDASVGILAI